MLRYACSNGRTTLVKNLMRWGEITPKYLELDVVNGGHSEIFWHFAAEGRINPDEWMSSYGVSIFHDLARGGFLYLITQLNSRNNKKARIDDIDYHGHSIFHHATEGDQWFVYCEMKKLIFRDNQSSFFDGKKLQVNKLGYNVAHIAAKEGNINFLNHLNKEDPDTLQQLTNDGSTVLHCAANSRNVSEGLLLMLIDFGVDPKVVNCRGQTVVDVLLSFEDDKEFFQQIANTMTNAIKSQKKCS